MNFDLGSGERIMIRRALTMYAGHFMAQKRLHVAQDDAYNAAYDQARIEAAERFSDRILRGMTGQTPGGLDINCPNKRTSNPPQVIVQGPNVSVTFNHDRAVLTLLCVSSQHAESIAHALSNGLLNFDTARE